MDLHALLQSVYDSPLATSIRQVGILFPAIESIHVIAITCVLGTIAIVDLRLVGYASHRRSANRLIHELLPFTWVAFVFAVITGSLMFASKAIDYADNGPFLWKMGALAAAGANMGIFHLGIHRRIGEWDETFPVPFAARMAGFTSLLLWTIVVFLGRWIGFTT
jgi:hypothetical protein